MVLKNAFENLATEAKQDAQETVLTEIRDRPVDAAEEDLIYQPISFNGVGDHTIVTVAADKRMRLKRFLLTAGDPDADPPVNPVLSFSFGGKTLRSTAFIGRFDILGAADEDFVLTASKAGQVDGTLGYVLEDA